mmetsp:Transcript_25069/g.63068  ORF Transcript_25069/g.63068 Transcript_25069/m.63068 type:complete len:152 (-) Transcript_25069:149-604(-)
MKNYSLEENGAKIIHFTSQYHHESRCSNLLNRNSGMVWFSSVTEPLPQHVIFGTPHPIDVKRLGIFLHGENNQNPRRIAFYVSDKENPAEEDFVKVIERPLEHRAGDFLYRVEDMENQDKLKEVRSVKLQALENSGGSGIYVSKVYIYGQP